jgi:anthranilate phosphoribosyltransferase
MYEWKAPTDGRAAVGDADRAVADGDPGMAPHFAVQARTVDPASLGLRPARLAELLGGDAATNAVAARRVLAGEAGAHRDVVLLNAAAGLVVAGVCVDLTAGLIVAASAIDDGRAEDALNRLIAVSREQADLLGPSGS